jgi:GABA permease
MRILIVANQTAAGDHLDEIVRMRMNDGTVEFTLLVPATPPSTGLVWTRTEAEALAKWRMEDAIARLGALGARIDGRIGDARPIDAIDDVLRERSYDEIILSTLPPGPSRWLKEDLPRKVRRRFGGRVTHLISKRAGRDQFTRFQDALRPTGS